MTAKQKDEIQREFDRFVSDKRELYEMALVGYRFKREMIEGQIEMVRVMLALQPTETMPVGPGGVEWPVRFVGRERLGKRGRREKARKGGRG